MDGGLKGEPDLVFTYGTSQGTFVGDVVYVVPGPSIPAVLLTLAPAVGLFHILCRKRK